MQMETPTSNGRFGVLEIFWTGRAKFSLHPTTRAKVWRSNRRILQVISVIWLSPLLSSDLHGTLIEAQE